MNPFYVNVLVGEADDNGDMNQYGCVCYKFDNWEEASKFIKLSLENDLIVEVRIPTESKQRAV